VRRILVILAALAALAPAAAVAAEPKTTLGDVEDEVMCPVCGTPLSLSTEAPQAQRERALIVRLI
jgi:cytochrome c-type biogenesis protein CcmH